MMKDYLQSRRSVHTLQDISGRVAIVTGGAGHIGSAIAEALLECGADIVLADKSVDALNARREMLEAKGFKGTIAIESIELQNVDALENLPHQVASRYGKIDILVNAAAIVLDKFIDGWAVPFENQDSRLWDEAFKINTTSAFVLARESSKYFGNDGNAGSIVNIISHYGILGPDWGLYEGTEMGNAAGYAASKGALLQLTRWLAATLAPKVRVNAITPGGVFRDHKDPFLSRYERKTLLGRMAIEEDFKGAAIFLASDQSRYITGQNIVVDGGLSII